MTNGTIFREATSETRARMASCARPVCRAVVPGRADDRDVRSSALQFRRFRECADFHEGSRAQVLRAVDLRVEVRCLRHSPALAVPLQVFENLARGVAAVDTADAAAGMGSGAAEVETPDGRPVIRVAGDGPPGKLEA